MKEVYRTSDPFQLALARHFLADHGIEAFVFDENAGGIYSGFMGVSARLMVIDEDAARAMTALKEFESS